MVSSSRLSKNFIGKIPAFFIVGKTHFRLSMGISYRSPSNIYLMGMRRQ